MSSQLQENALKRKLSDAPFPCPSDAVHGRRDHLEALERYKRNEPVGIGKDPDLNLYIWQDPHQPREVVSDGEDDEWRAPPGSLLGSDILARLYHSSDFASASQDLPLELETGRGNGPTEIGPRHPTAQESRQERGTLTANVPTGTEPSTHAATESRQELEIVPAETPETMARDWRSVHAVLARTNKYVRRPGSTETSKEIRRSDRNLTSRESKFARQHSTNHYTKFDPNSPYHVQAVIADYPWSTSCFYNYRGYHLCVDPSIINALDIPQLPVRLDDRLVALAYEYFGLKERHQLWPSEFDANGMVRAGRIPLGFAAKHEYRVGDADLDGNILQPGEEGWYYLWLGGYHCLMGKEGMDAGRFQPRRGRAAKFNGFAFRKSHRAEIQAPPGVESER